MNKKIGMIAGAVVLTGVIGTGVYHTNAEEAKQELITPETLTMEEATQKLEEQYQGTVKEIELDKERNKLYYDAEIWVENQEYDVEMDAETGEIVEEKVDDDFRNEENQQQVDSDFENEGNQQKEAVEKKDLITQEKAIENAKQEFDGEVTELELDYDDGRYVYEMELVNGQQEADIDIDGETGDIVSLEIDYEDD